MKNQIRNIIAKTHFYLLGIALLNFLIKSTIEISLNYQFAYLITILIYISGIVLFFENIRPIRKIVVYFSIYIITPILTLLFWSFGGILLGLLSSIVLYPIYPIEIKAESNNIVIYTKYQGFMGACCPYEVNERKFLILEKKLTEIDLNEIIDFERVSFNSQDRRNELRIRHHKYDYKTEKTIATDTIISINTE